MKTRRPSLAGRAVLALILMAGFYLLAIAMAAGLLYIPYAEWQYAERLHIKLALICVCGAGAILWAILPRLDHFTPPGPRLEASCHPRLFGELTSIAQSVKQEMPSEVYLVPEVNAWVTHRGGVMGLGGRRVMGLGLPLLKVLKTSELRAVLAHEFGHYQGGDTALAPWVYKTRSAIIRTLQNLGDSILQKPFMLYGKMFLRITHAISRQEEYAADELAARVAGAGAMISGLKTIHSAGAAFNSYWRGEVAPILSAGYRPPVADGFAAFMKSEPIVKGTAEFIAKQMETANRDPYDTHPPLKDRIAALADFAIAQPPDNDPAAIALLEDVGSLERELLVLSFGADKSGKLKDIRWEDALETVFVPAWREQCKEHARGLAGIHLGALPDLVGNQSGLISRFKDSVPTGLPEEQLAPAIAGIIGSAVALVLKSMNFTISSDIGYPVTARAGSIAIEPFSLVHKLASGEIKKDAWTALCNEAQLTDVDLGGITGVAPAAQAVTTSQAADEPESFRQAGDGEEAEPLKDGELACPGCGEIYRPADYRADATEWLCSACKQPLPKSV